MEFIKENPEKIDIVHNEKLKKIEEEIVKIFNSIVANKSQNKLRKIIENIYEIKITFWLIFLIIPIYYFSK